MPFDAAMLYPTLECWGLLPLISHSFLSASQTVLEFQNWAISWMRPHPFPILSDCVLLSQFKSLVAAMYCRTANPISAVMCIWKSRVSGQQSGVTSRPVNPLSHGNRVPFRPVSAAKFRAAGTTWSL